MTDEQINEKIAEISDWKKAPEAIGVGWWFRPCEPGDNLRKLSLSGPNYCNDLNAMHKAEQQLRGFDGWMSYDKFLAELAEGFTWHATARQRAEAFLRTLNLWEE